MINSIKNSRIFKFLSGKDFKTKFIKLAIILCLMFATFMNGYFAYGFLGVCAIYIAFEFSADSILWLAILCTKAQHINTNYIYILLIELLIILLIKFIRDIINKKIDCKNLRFIAICSIWLLVALLMLLPFATHYRFLSQIKRLVFFTTLILGVFYIKEINIKDLFILFTISVVINVMLYVAAITINEQLQPQFPTQYSKGVVHRFSPFYADPNFTGGILICAITSWFVTYRKKWINQHTYFVGLLFLGMFSIMTISKATYLTIALFGLYVVIENVVITVRTKNPRHLLELVYYLGVVLAACVIQWKYVDAFCQRIIHPEMGVISGNTDVTNINNITTGRLDIWKAYFTEMFGSWRILLFGAGMGAPWVVRPEHSMLIGYLYRGGLLVCGALVTIFIISAWPYLKKCKVYSIIPLICITGIYGSIGSPSAQYIYVFVIEFLAICCNGFKDQKQQTIEFKDQTSTDQSIQT